VWAKRGVSEGKEREGQGEGEKGKEGASHMAYFPNPHCFHPVFAYPYFTHLIFSPLTALQCLVVPERPCEEFRGGTSKCQDPVEFQPEGAEHPAESHQQCFNHHPQLTEGTTNVCICSHYDVMLY
jgi:hypothetical protein